MSGGKGWRLSLVRLVEKCGIPEIQAVCVVSKARARRGKAFRMKALAVQKPSEKGLRGRGLVAGAINTIGLFSGLMPRCMFIVSMSDRYEQRTYLEIKAILVGMYQVLGCCYSNRVPFQCLSNYRELSLQRLSR